MCQSNDSGYPLEFCLCGISAITQFVITPANPFPMDCTDVVIGFAYGDLSYVADYYTRDRSTPRRDEFYGGVDSLTGAVGWEVDGTTTIIFRKKLEGTEKYPIYPSHLVWRLSRQIKLIYGSWINLEKRDYLQNYVTRG